MRMEFVLTLRTWPTITSFACLVYAYIDERVKSDLSYELTIDFELGAARSVVYFSLEQLFDGDRSK